MDDTRPFPIQQGVGVRGDKSCTVPWWLAEIAHYGYVKMFGNIQTLERIAERGGFGREELLMLIIKAAEK